MSSMSPEVIRGVNTLLGEYAIVGSDDFCVIAYTLDSRDPAAWVAVGLKMRGIPTRLVPMSPLVDDEFADRLKSALPDPSDVGGRLIVITLERDTMSHFEPLRWVREYFGPDRCQILRIISATEEFFTEAMNVTPRTLSGLNAGLLHKLSGRHQLRVETKGGTDLEIELDEERFDWISNRGVWRPGGFTILPAGEIATYPAKINGRLVADGAVNCNIMSRLDMRLGKQPLIVDIVEGEAVDVRCDNDEILELVTLCLNRPHGRRVGELGFGTNIGISQFIAHNSHINERRSGIHIGFGQHNQPRTIVSYYADVHMDLITAGARIWVDDDPDPIDLESISPTDEPHPISVRDEDIVEDCCGLGYGQLRSLCEVRDNASPSPQRGVS